MGYVFISYSTKNQAAADAMRELLKSRGYQTWMAPGDIPAGYKYAQVISQAVKNCACFLLMLSDDAQKSVWVPKEVERAVNYRRPIIPVQLEDIDLNDEFEMYISSDQVVAVRKIDADSAEMKNVLESVAIYTGVEAVSEEPAEQGSIRCFLLSCFDGTERSELNFGTHIVGRDKRKAHIPIDDNTVSQIHAVITVLKDRAYIQDLNTMNGTFVNGKRLEIDCEQSLCDGDVIVFGNRAYVFQMLRSSGQELPTKREGVCIPKIEIGAVIDGKYRILRLLGQGTLSRVFLAESTKTKKKWAVKVIGVSQETTDNFKKRLKNEIDVLNKINHPGLPTIADYFQTEGELIVVMDYIEGTPLSCESAQSEQTLIDWAKQLCDILGCLHSQKPAVIHNDIHPSNILCGSDGRISMINFGNALEYDASVRNGYRPGTTFFTAPEKLGGVIDKRTDIFALGMTLYVLATGVDPSKAPYTMPPVRQANPQISPEFVKIIDKCTERNPLDRYQTVQELLDDLNRVDAQPKLKKKKRSLWPFSKK